MNGKPGASNVLVVDDDEKNLRLMRALLEPQGMRVVTAGNGKECLALVFADAPDLILLDMIMPEMNGFQVIESLKADPNTMDIPIMVVSSLDDVESRNKALEKGAADFILKPINKIELGHRVRNTLRLREYSEFLKDRNLGLEESVLEKTELLRHSHIEAIVALATASEFRDEETGAHAKRIGFFANVWRKPLG